MCHFLTRIFLTFAKSVSAALQSLSVLLIDFYDSFRIKFAFNEYKNLSLFAIFWSKFSVSPIYLHQFAFIYFFQGIHPLKNDFLEVESDESYDTVSATIDAANDEVLLKEVRQNLFDVHNKRVLKNFDKLTGYTILNQGGTAFS